LKKQWAESKAIAFERQAGLCLVCENPLKFSNCTGHHKINRCQGGPSNADNCEVRHTACERMMHSQYPFGNYEGNLGGTNVGRSAVRRRRNSGGRGKHSPAPPIVHNEAIEPSTDSDLCYLIVLQCDVANSCDLDLTRLGSHRIEFSINADNNVHLDIYKKISEKVLA